MRRTILAGLALLFATTFTQGSDPVGVYAVIDKVEIIPSEGMPEQVRIWGYFRMAERKGGDEYAPVAKGYLFYSLPKEKQENARKEWTDLSKLAGKKQVVGFGSRYKNEAKVRNDPDITKDAKPYPVGFGLTKVPDNNPLAKQLLQAQAKP